MARTHQQQSAPAPDFSNLDDETKAYLRAELRGLRSGLEALQRRIEHHTKRLESLVFGPTATESRLRDGLAREGCVGVSSRILETSKQGKR